MASAQDHYARHLGPVYSWMAGGTDAAVQRGDAELGQLQLRDGAGALAIDLGAGFGMHAIPLARRGFSVLAIDSDAGLLHELTTLAGSLALRTINGDLVDFRRHFDRSARVVLCMGDTLTHLANREAIMTLFADIAAVLEPAGTCLLSFRDYREALTGERRFIPLRSDDDRILTCFLDYSASSLVVHDLLHERESAGGWKLHVSTYRKLRLDPVWVIAALEACGLSVVQDVGLGGMIRLMAKKAG